MQLTEHFSIMPITVNIKSDVFLKDFFSKFEDIGKKQLIHPHFLKKCLKERLHFSGCLTVSNMK